MRKNFVHFPNLAILLIVMLTACGPNAMPVATDLPPTETTVPPMTTSSPPTATSQPEPTSCLIASDSVSALNALPDQTLALLPDTKAFWYNSFDCKEQSNAWGNVHANPTTKISVANSILTISTQKVENQWEGVGLGSGKLADKKGLLLLFQYQAGTTVNLFVSTGEWQTPNYRRWGLDIVNDRPAWEGWEGSLYLDSYFPPNVVRPNTPYYLIVNLNDGGKITMKVWEKDNPNNHADFQKRMPNTWIGLPWASLLQLYEGTIEIDEYLEYSFEKP